MMVADHLKFLSSHTVIYIRDGRGEKKYIYDKYGIMLSRQQQKTFIKRVEDKKNERERERER